MKLEDLQTNAAVRGVLPDGFITVVSVQWFGSEALELTYKTTNGKVANELLYRDDEGRLEIAEAGRPWSFDGVSPVFRLDSETMSNNSLVQSRQEMTHLAREQRSPQVEQISLFVSRENLA